MVRAGITDRVSLVAALRAAGIRDGENYEIAGLVRLAQDVGPYLFLVERGGRWVVGSRERRLESVLGEYATEQEAAQLFYDRVLYEWETLRHPKPPRRDLPRLSRQELIEETRRLEREAERLNAEWERKIAEM